MHFHGVTSLKGGLLATAAVIVAFVVYDLILKIYAWASSFFQKDDGRFKIPTDQNVFYNQLCNKIKNSDFSTLTQFNICIASIMAQFRKDRKVTTTCALTKSPTPCPARIKGKNNDIYDGVVLSAIVKSRKNLFDLFKKEKFSSDQIIKA